MWQIYDCDNGIFAPHYCHNHTMVPNNWTSSFNHSGSNLFVFPQTVVLYFISTLFVNCYISTHNQVDHNRDSYLTFIQNNVINEGNIQECNIIEVQLVGNDSLPGKFSFHLLC